MGDHVTPLEKFFLVIQTFMSGKQSGTPMTQSAASRIQAAEAKAGNGGVKAGGFAARAQSAAARTGGESKGGSHSAHSSGRTKGYK
ncbi:hypothetical protein KFL_002560030 [Klebsormidium nitens]|uniref:SMP domain-containing protein n=1 Tax=Klebsormidium nitens TaxID=105231 RepID=A0A0U9HLY8_KLENI|nr:hypothetical protein KFL_002560030 [Klebsormidium nitens]|eukprot:GAQ85817.1 hypothetical protein KFL_002560030 [Klebsormidium nitens]